MPTIHFRSNGTPAVNVKDRHLYAHDPRFAPFYESLGEGGVERVYEDVQRDFWATYAPEIAAEFGYGDVYSAGRSGGWLTVEKAPELEEEPDPACEACGHVLLTTLVRETGHRGVQEQCDACGHVQESPLHARRVRWAEFEQRIGDAMETAREEFVRRLGEAVEEKNAEPEIPRVVEEIIGQMDTFTTGTLLKLGESVVREICERFDSVAFNEAGYHGGSRMATLSMALGDAFDALASEVRGDGDDDDK